MVFKLYQLFNCDMFPMNFGANLRITIGPETIISAHSQQNVIILDHINLRKI